MSRGARVSVVKGPGPSPRSGPIERPFLPTSLLHLATRTAAVLAISAGSIVVHIGTADAAGGGTTITNASTAQIGVTEFGDTASPGMAPNNGSPISANCPAGSSSPSREQTWQVNLVAGDQVTLTGGYSPPAKSMDIAFWPAATDDAEVLSGTVAKPTFVGSNIGGYAGGSLGQQQSSIVFTVPTTGTYPFAVGNCDGSTGPYQFTLTVQEPRLALREISGQITAVRGEPTAVLAVSVRTRNNYAVNNGLFQFMLNCETAPELKCTPPAPTHVINDFAKVYFSPIASVKGPLPGKIFVEVSVEGAGYEGSGLFVTFLSPG